MSKKFEKIILMLALFSFTNQSQIAQSKDWQQLQESGQESHEQGNDLDAESYLLQALKSAEQNNADDSRIISCLWDLARVYKSEGKYAEAEPVCVRALDLYKKVKGDEHPDVAYAMNKLAEIYRLEKKYSQAEPLYKQAIAMDEKLADPNDPDLSQIINNLGLLYSSTGKYAEAEACFKRVLATREKQYAAGDPLIADTLENYAAVLRKMNRDKEALPMEDRAKAIRAQI